MQVARDRAALILLQREQAAGHGLQFAVAGFQCAADAFGITEIAHDQQLAVAAAIAHLAHCQAGMEAAAICALHRHHAAVARPQVQLARTQLAAHAGQIGAVHQCRKRFAQQGVAAIAEQAGGPGVGVQHVFVGEDHHTIGQHPHQLAELFLTLAQQATRLLALGHVLQGAQHAAAASFIDTAGGAQVHHQRAPVHRQDGQQHVHLHRLAGA